jgi:hypothetical protein
VQAFGRPEIPQSRSFSAWPRRRGDVRGVLTPNPGFSNNLTYINALRQKRGSDWRVRFDQKSSVRATFISLIYACGSQTMTTTVFLGDKLWSSEIVFSERINRGVDSVYPRLSRAARSGAR